MFFFRGQARIKEAKFELFRHQEAKLATLKHFMVRRPDESVQFRYLLQWKGNDNPFMSGWISLLRS